ncbi:MAG: hypothetical protein CM15mP87_07800 [Candidatus Neomarinimicrobiota bacterium]|nr:MAG: hypothetical protein CM15mP87_07800 [Candidatus Neomarinimicrobiota bacterium]
MLCSDQDVIDNPNEFYDEYFEIDLNQLEPLLNGPFTPDRSTPISKMTEEAKKRTGLPKLKLGLLDHAQILPMKTYLDLHLLQNRHQTKA